ncbi:NAD(P)/FAD-dependent oxidoreductase [Candidatus Solincola tengchongensis]|uniref:NAD(P)/FAD-dependent oxidoreductase n=1 Tax=Candidatus Solincola tengchongensis TaxID=2900693 RepID=UPI00257C8882
MEKSFDVVVVGAGTSGTYFSWRLSEAGFRCLVLEKEKLDSLGRSIGPFHMEEPAFERFNIPLPQGDELLHRLETITMWSPNGEHRVTARLVTMDMDKPAFMKRLRGYAVASGVEFREETEFLGLVRERGFPAGVRVRGDGGEYEIRCRLVVEASGIRGAVRTGMPSTPWWESEPVEDMDTLVVYMESWKELEGEFNPGINSYLHFQGWYAPSYGEEMIVGVGMPASRDGARRRHRAFASTLPFRGVTAWCTEGRVPYRRPPLSLVDNGIMVVGDAAFMNKPFSGEGVTSGFAACRIAADVAAEALAEDDLTREALWPYNVRYFRDQGAKFAFLAAFMPAVVSLSPREVDFLYSVPGIFTEEGTVALNLEYEMRSDPVETARAFPVLAGGIASGKLRPASVTRLALMGSVAAKLRRLYEAYPEHPATFASWADRVRPLWRKADRVRHDYFRKLIREWA